MLNSVDCPQKSMLLFPATLNIVGPPKRRLSMSKSFRLSLVWAGLLAMMLGISQAAAGQLIISEFRVRGPSGANDDFVEIYNNSGADHTVAGGGTGYAIARLKGAARWVFPNSEGIPQT